MLFGLYFYESLLVDSWEFFDATGLKNIKGDE